MGHVLGINNAAISITPLYCNSQCPIQWTKISFELEYLQNWVPGYIVSKARLRSRTPQGQGTYVTELSTDCTTQSYVSYTAIMTLCHTYLVATVDVAVRSRLFASQESGQFSFIHPFQQFALICT